MGHGNWEVRVVRLPQCLPEKIMKTFIKDIKFFTVHNKKILALKSLKAVDDTIFKNSQAETEYLISIALSMPQQLLDFYFTLGGFYNAHVKTSMPIMLEITLKSFTSNVKELETKTTYIFIEKSSLCPKKIKENLELFAGVT
ncbi:hypothetical protein PV328_004194 [Microctonus aethiopoides]|uniref:Uncharacterized protein n=1 Tax=Microctonus aethiopoides TaxID=144406 RepID=A0AA39FA83_9HYME|nr:hypothetical protein PV328_004194 [Microctonus aethiopoides]